MSLLNDMLRDLSQRQTVPQGAQNDDEQLLQSSSFGAKKRSVWLQLSVLFLAVFSAVLVLNHVVVRTVNVPVTGVANKLLIAAPTQTENKSIPAPVIAAVVSNVISSSPLRTATPVSDAAADSALQNQTQVLLQQAERAMAMDRLTTPIEDNAYAYYQKILSISESNNAAKEGLDSIAQRYLSKAQAQAQLGNLAQAEVLLARARFVSARFVDAHTLEFSELMPPVIAQSLPAAGDLAASAPPASSETIKPFVVAEASAVVAETPAVLVTPNTGWQDEQLALHAQMLIQQGKSAEAQVLLKNAVASETAPARCAALLAELYLQQENTLAATLILQQAKYLALDVKVKLNAQLFMLQGDSAQAIALLEQHLPSAVMNEGYRALLASLYHKTKNYPQSILSYQRLIKNFGDKPAYWLGVALAYDGLSQANNALQAYLRLREFPQLQVQVTQYTDQRIAALRGE